MIKFPSDLEPTYYTSVTKENETLSKWCQWTAIIIAVLVALCGGILAWSKLLKSCLAVSIYFCLPLLLKLCVSKLKSSKEEPSFTPPIKKSKEEIFNLIETWKQILAEDPPTAWVLFSGGTCVIFNEPVADLLSEAKSILKEWGPYVIGSPSADMLVITLRENLGYLTGGHHPGIFAFVEPEIVGESTGSYLAGHLGRSFRDLDAKTLEVIYHEQKVSAS